MGLIDTWLVRPERRTLENPSTSLSNPDEWLWEAFGAVEASSGESVNAELALKYAPWWRGINLVSRDVAKLPLLVYRREGAGKQKDTTHPAYRLLRYRANDELMSAFTFKQTVQALAMSTGNGYAWIRRDRNAVPLELIIIDPITVVPFRENGRLWYGVKIDGTMRRVNPTDILHIKGLSRDGLVGYSVYANARESLGEGIGAQKYGSRFLKNNARPSVVIEVPGNMAVEAQKEFIRQWEMMYGGIENSHRTAILTNGGKVNPLSVNARDSQLVDIRKFNLVDIANWIGVPVHKVGGEGRTAFASLEQENQAYLDESLDPWLVCWESECREKLLTEQQKDRDTHVIEFVRQALVRADMPARGTYYQLAVRGGWMSRDEVRALENMNPMPGDDGGQFFAPLELQVVGSDQPPEIDDPAALLAITEKVVDGTLPPDAAKAMLKAEFPLVTDATVSAIIDPLEVKEVEPVAPPTVPAAMPEPDTEAQRSVIVDAVRRAVRYLRIQAVRRSKLDRNFLSLIDEDREADAAKVAEIVGPAVAMVNRSAGDVAGMILDDAKRVLLEAAGAAHSRDELTRCVEERMTEYEAAAPELAADSLLGGSAGE